MHRYRFGNTVIRIENEPEVPAGAYLDVFEVDSASEDITVHYVQGRIAVSDQAADNGEVIVDGNRVICRYGFLKHAVSYSRKDWCTDYVEPQMDPELRNQKFFTLNELLFMSGIHEAFLYRNALLLHASYIVHNGTAVIFTAPSGTGKSTQASLWEKYKNAEIINGDRVLLYFEDDTLYAGGFSACGSSDVCRNVSAPVKAIVVLEQGKDNEITVMRKVKTFSSLLAASVYFHWSEEENKLAGDTVMRIMDSVPVVKFSCTPDEDAVNALNTWLEK